MPLPVVGAKGAEIYLGDGSSLIDACSSWWVNLHGHGHPYLIEKVEQQLHQLAHVAFADLTHEPAATLAERLHDLLPGHPQRTFFSDNGSTAVESALKMALQATGKKRIVALRGGYHGETFGAMALSERTLFSRPFADHLFEVDFIDPPNSARSIEQMKQLLAGGDVAAFFFEPTFQGVGGMRSHSAELLSSLIDMCQREGVLTIADEILTGCGRTGPRFASERLSPHPDIICLAKALTGGFLPLGVTACREELFERFLDADRRRALLHGHSYTANPLACAAALASLDLLVTPECDRQRASIEAAHKQFAAEIAPHVQRAEVVGTILVVELEGDGYFATGSNATTQPFVERGVLLRPFGNVIHVIPPYCISQDQLGKVYEAISAVVAHEALYA